MFNGKAIKISSHSSEKYLAIDTDETVIDFTPNFLNHLPTSKD